MDGDVKLEQVRDRKPGFYIRVRNTVLVLKAE